MEEPRNLELDTAITADPDDLELYRVYADWFEASGCEPRAQLIRAQLAASTDDAAALVRTLLRKQRASLLGPCARFTDHLVWKAGFVTFATLDRDGQLATLLAHASGRFVQTLDLEVHESTLVELAERAPATLRELHLHGGPVELRGLAHVVARLRTLSAMVHVRLVEPLVMPHATELTWAMPDASTIAVLAAAELPMIRRLGFYFEDRPVADLAPIFARTWPTMTDLALGGIITRDDLAEILGRFPALEKLRVISDAIGDGELDDLVTPSRTIDHERYDAIPF